MTETEKLCAEVLRLDAEATPGPFEVCGNSFAPIDPNQGHWENDPPDWIEWMSNGSYEKCCIDAKLFAYYRTAAPALARAYQRQAEEVTRLREALQKTVKNCSACRGRGKYEVEHWEYGMRDGTKVIDCYACRPGRAALAESGEA